MIDKFLAVAFSIFSLFIILASLNLPAESRWYPQVLAFLLLLLAVMLFISSLRHGHKGMKELEDAENDRNGLPENLREPLINQRMRPLLGFILVFLYMVLIPLLGFLIATPLFILAWGYGFGYVRPKTLVLTTVTVTVATYLVFSMLLNVPLPDGLLVAL